MTEAYELPEGAEETAAMIVRAAEEMNRLIGDLLDVTRIEEPGPKHFLDSIEEISHRRP